MMACLAWSHTLQAQCTELFFSEYIEGSGNNKCIEIFNPTGAAIDLAAGNYTVVRFSNGSTNGITINLTGTIEKAGVNIDVFGQIGFDPGSEWTGGGVGTQNHTLVRMASISQGDPNGGDAFDPSLEWIEFPSNTVDNLGSHSSDTCPIVIGCDELFFSEYIEGSSNNKCIEIYNPTANPIDLAAGAYTVVRFSNGGTNGTIINLTGTVASV